MRRGRMGTIGRRRRVGRVLAAGLVMSLLGACYDIRDDQDFGGPSYTWTTVTGPVAVSGDDTSAVVTSPFALRMFPGSGTYGVTSTDIEVSTNGFILTDQAADGTISSVPCPQSTAGVNEGRYDVFLDDLTTTVRTEARGSAPDRVFVVQWAGTEVLSGAAVSFQALFFEAYDDVLYLYEQTGSTGGGSAAVGAVWNGVGGTEVDTYSCDSPGALVPGRAIQLTENGQTQDPLTPPNVPPSGVSVTASVPTAVEGGTPGVFTFSRTGSPATSLTIGYQVSGTATPGADYEPFGIVTFNAGQASVTKQVVAVADDLPEPAETVQVSLVPGGYEVGSPSQATVTIEDGVAPPPEPTPDPDPCVSAPVSPFRDVPAANVHAGNIACLAELDLARGGPGGLPADQYGPRQVTTRGQIASFVARMLSAAGATVPSEPADAFNDDDASVHELAINQLAALGIIGGNGEAGTTFGVSDPIQRDEMASLLHRAVELLAGEPLTADTDVFTDDEDSPHEAAINALESVEIVEGPGNGTFDPAGTVQRDSMASFLVRTVQYLAAQGHFPIG